MTALLGPAGTSPGAPRWPYALRGPLALARAAVDRAAHRRTDAAWLARAWADPQTRVLAVVDGRTQVVVDASGTRLALLAPAEAPAGERYLLGVDGEGTVYLAVRATAEQSAESPAAVGARWADLRTVGALLDERDAGLMVHAVALANWHRTHPRCARCGASTLVAAGGHSRRCPECGAEHFPRTDPAVIVLVVDDADRALLGRQAVWPVGRWSTLAGFVEAGESIEAAAVREVFEEAGIRIGDVRYVGDQPWPFPASLMLGCYARARSTTIDVDGDELAEARWFTRADLGSGVGKGSVLLPPRVSIARRLVEGWFGSDLPREGSWR